MVPLYMNDTVQVCVFAFWLCYCNNNNNNSHRRLSHIQLASCASIPSVCPPPRPRQPPSPLAFVTTATNTMTQIDPSCDMDPAVEAKGVQAILEQLTDQERTAMPDADMPLRHFRAEKVSLLGCSPVFAFAMLLKEHGPFTHSYFRAIDRFSLHFFFREMSPKQCIK